MLYRFFLTLVCIALISICPQQTRAGWVENFYTACTATYLIGSALYMEEILGAPIGPKGAGRGNGTQQMMWGRPSDNRPGVFIAGRRTAAEGFGANNLGQGITVLAVLFGKDILVKIGTKVKEAEWARRIGIALGRCCCSCLSTMRQWRHQKNIIQQIPDQGLLDADLFRLATNIAEKAKRFRYSIQPDERSIRFIVPKRSGQYDLVALYAPDHAKVVENTDLCLAPLDEQSEAGFRALIRCMIGRDEFLLDNLRERVNQWVRFDAIQEWVQLDLLPVPKNKIRILVLGKYDPRQAKKYHVGLKLAIVQNIDVGDETDQEFDSILHATPSGDFSTLSSDVDGLTVLHALERNYLATRAHDDNDEDEDDLDFGASFNPNDLRTLMQVLQDQDLTLDEFLEQGPRALGDEERNFFFPPPTSPPFVFAPPQDREVFMESREHRKFDVRAPINQRAKQLCTSTTLDSGTQETGGTESRIQEEKTSPSNVIPESEERKKRRRSSGHDALTTDGRGTAEERRSVFTREGERSRCSQQESEDRQNLKRELSRLSTSAQQNRKYERLCAIANQTCKKQKMTPTISARPPVSSAAEQPIDFENDGGAAVLPVSGMQATWRPTWRRSASAGDTDTSFV